MQYLFHSRPCHLHKISKQLHAPLNPFSDTKRTCYILKKSKCSYFLSSRFLRRNSRMQNAIWVDMYFFSFNSFWLYVLSIYEGVYIHVIQIHRRKFGKKSILIKTSASWVSVVIIRSIFVEKNPIFLLKKSKQKIVTSLHVMASSACQQSHHLLSETV